jgi:hypothetical protein
MANPSSARYIGAMSKKSPPKPDDPAQYKRFLEAAREAEADETKEAADSAFQKVASAKPKADHPRRSGKQASS